MKLEDTQWRDETELWLRAEYGMGAAQASASVSALALDWQAFLDTLTVVGETS